MDSVASVRKYVTASTAASSMPRVSAPTPGVYVAVIRFVVATRLEAEVKAAFRERQHRVDRTAGFVRTMVMCPLDRPQEIPKGLKLVGRETSIRELEVVCE
ncbi:MAG: hypothetical protein ABIR94_15625 [Rubrivivax sp.]